MKFATQLWTAVALGAFACIPVAVSAQQQQQSTKLPPGIVARQGGAVVSLQDIDAYAQKIPESDRAGFFDSPKRIESMIMSLLLQKQLATEARKEKLDADPGVKVEMQQAVDDALARAAMQYYRDNIKLPDFEALAHEHYLSHKQDFVLRGAVDVKHVLVSTKNRSDAEAKARIAEVEAAAHAHPDQFDALVDKYSDDPSKSDNHGLIEDAASSRTVEPFSKAATELRKPGEISPIVKTDFGYHVLQLVSHKPDKQLTFAEVRDGLKDKLRHDFVEQESTDRISKLRGGALEADADLVASIRTRFLPKGANATPSQAAEAAEKAEVKQAKPEAVANQQTPAH